MKEGYILWTKKMAVKMFLSWTGLTMIMVITIIIAIVAVFGGVAGVIEGVKNKPVGISPTDL